MVLAKAPVEDAVSESVKALFVAVVIRYAQQVEFLVTKVSPQSLNLETDSELQVKLVQGLANDLVLHLDLQDLLQLTENEAVNQELVHLPVEALDNEESQSKHLVDSLRLPAHQSGQVRHPHGL